MAALSTTHPTLLDVTKRLDPNGKIDTIAEILTQTNEILEDMVWLEGNLPTGHRTSVQTSLPTGTWRRFNEGIVPTKSTSTQITGLSTEGFVVSNAAFPGAAVDLTWAIYPDATGLPAGPGAGGVRGPGRRADVIANDS